MKHPYDDSKCWNCGKELTEYEILSMTCTKCNQDILQEVNQVRRAIRNTFLIVIGLSLISAGAGWLLARGLPAGVTHYKKKQLDTSPE